MTDDQNDPLRLLLSRSSVVLFDFDGPLCDVFAGSPADSIARDLELVLGSKVDTDDPLEVLRAAAQSDGATVGAVEDALVAAEVAAVRKSVPTPGGVEAVRACLAKSLNVGIVSNNSADCVSAFLESQGLVNAVHPVIGRSRGRPELMKPSRWPLATALAKLGKQPDEAVFIGDSMTDIEVARIVNVPCVGYANKAGKRRAFECAGVIVVDSMWELVSSIDVR